MVFYSVAETANMLGVSEETVRRWIRDDKLKAKRGLGRNGNSITLESIVEFANTPPRLYLSALIKWLEQHSISYKIIKDTPKQHEKQIITHNKNALGGIGLTGLAAVTPVLGPIGVAAALAGGTTVGVMNHMMRKKYADYSIEISVDSADSTVSPAEFSESSLEEMPRQDAVHTGINKEPQATQDADSNEIEQKIIEEQINLLKLNQKHAQLVAQITISENQIEYYNLLASNYDAEDTHPKILQEQINLVKLKQELAQITAQVSISKGQIEYYKLIQSK